MSEVLIDTQHSDVVHDSQFDYYGQRLATCSSDRSIRIFQVSEDYQSQFVRTLLGHEGPVWRVAWSHPKFGSYLASCSYDARVIVWAEVNGDWQQVYSYQHRSSVNGLAWAPHEWGLRLAAGASDGSISIHSLGPTNQWEVKLIESAHRIAVSGISWAPAFEVEAPRFVSSGCDGRLVIHSQEESENWVSEALEPKETAWIRDVCWSPVNKELIASGNDKGQVTVWRYSADDGKWKASELKIFDGVVWSVSWSPVGTVLSATFGDNELALWRETVDGNWEPTNVEEMQVPDETSGGVVSNPLY